MAVETTTTIRCDVDECASAGTLGADWTRADAKAEGWQIRMGLIPSAGWALCPEHAE